MNTRVARITFTLLTFALAASGTEFHVASRGRDFNPGTKYKPFATPARAMQAVRALVLAGLKSDVRVILHGGTYNLDAPMVFTSADSGSVEFAITYLAAPGETVIISGGREITNWMAAPGGSKWTATLPTVKSGQWFFRQLTVNDHRAARARWPNEDGVVHLAAVDKQIKSFTFDRPLPFENLSGQDAELVVYENWSVSRALVASSDQRRLATTTAVGWIGHEATTASPGKPAFIENARAALDQPHEWFLERTTGTLTYLPAPGEKPAQTRAIAPILTQLVRIAGTKEKLVRNVRFERLHFEHTDFPLPSIGYSEIQAAHFGSDIHLPTRVQPVAIECLYAEGIRFEHCRLAHLNNSGIGFGPGCRRNILTNCVLEDIGGNGIMIGWRGAGQLNAGAEGTLDADWLEPGDVPRGNQVAKCVIRRCGADSCGAVGVWVAFSADTRVAQNVIHDLPYTGISIGYRWNTNATSQVRCIVEYNHIYDVMKKLADGGGVYTLGFQPGTVLRGNLIHDFKRSPFAHGGAPNNGFFIDEGSKGFLFESNVVYNTSGEPVRFNQCQAEWHSWKGNAFGADVTPARIAAAQRAVCSPDPDISK